LPRIHDSEGELRINNLIPAVSVLGGQGNVQNQGLLIVTEELRTGAAPLPPDQFQKVMAFFDTCHGADRQNAMLVKN
jgi:hypothetical protein